MADGNEHYLDTLLEISCKILRESGEILIKNLTRFLREILRELA